AAGMVRETSDLFRLGDETYDLRYAALTDHLQEVVRCFDAVIHTAARSSDWGDYDSFYRANVEGTVNLLRASVAGGVRRFIHFSSTVIYGFGGNRLTGEDHPPAPFNHPYCLTKAEAEEECLRFRDRIHLVILRPSNVFGPSDLTTTYPLLTALRKGMPAFPAGGRYLTSPCYVDNLVAATVLALGAGCPSGEAFNISDGGDLTWKEFLGLFAAELGVKPPRVALPTGLLFPAAALLEKLYVCCGSSRPPLITPYRIAQVAADYSFSIEKARKMLGYQPPVTTEEGVRRSVEWYGAYSDR
ncbi:MAG: NAD-dependent epimerase/dehydratase family protein, partial [PVC group bacterium]